MSWRGGGRRIELRPGHWGGEDNLKARVRCGMSRSCAYPCYCYWSLLSWMSCFNFYSDICGTLAGSNTVLSFLMLNVELIVSHPPGTDANDVTRRDLCMETRVLT